MYYRVRAKCQSCGLKWTTRKKNNKYAPVQCPDCHSGHTRATSYWEVK